MHPKLKNSISHKFIPFKKRIKHNVVDQRVDLKMTGDVPTVTDDPRGGTRPKLGYNAQHKLKIWTLRGLKTSEKAGLKDPKCVFGKFEIGGLKDLNRVIEENCQSWILDC